MTAIPAMTATAFGRFAAKVELSPVGCWNWQGGIDPTGYGRFHLAAGRMGYSHRVAYEWAVGPIPAGLDLDHLCRNRCCCNPAHLEAVTRKVNLGRSPITLSSAHAEGRDCGFVRCRACRRFREGAVA